MTEVLFSGFRELLSVFALHLEAGIYVPHGGAFVVQVHPRIQERRAVFLAESVSSDGVIDLQRLRISSH